MRDILNQISEELDKIEEKFPPLTKRLIEIEA